MGSTTNRDRITSSIKYTISHELSMLPKPSIFRAPIILSRHNPQAYVPDAFSFGPFHHDKPNLKPAEKIKAWYLQRLISRSPSPDTKLSELVTSIEAVEKEARRCYAGQIDCTPDEFIQILVIDGCFIIELFRKHTYIELREEDDPIFTMSCLLQFLNHDLILLENQVPWMVLERLFCMTMQRRDQRYSLMQLAMEFFANIFSSAPITSTPASDRGAILQDIEHILDLLRKLLISSVGEDREQELGWRPMPSATSLSEAGIRFRRRKNFYSILDIDFKDGVLEIPPLLIQETTETIFRNLISFEQCYPNCEPRFTSYAVLLDNLINTTKDVDILWKNDIIANWLNPEDAVQFFNKLYHNSYVKQYYYLSVCRYVNIYYQRRWPKWRAVLVRNYFNHPWAILSILAVFASLVLSLLQTVFTIKKC